MLETMNKTTLTMISTACLALAMPATVIAGESAALDAAGVMRNTEAAIKQLKAVEYRFEQRNHGETLETLPRMEGRVVLAGATKNMFVEKFHLDTKIRKPGESEPTRLRAGADGNIVYLFDDKQKKVYADIDPAVLGSQSFTIMETVIGNFLAADPFEYEKKAEKIELKEVTKVGDEECYPIRFKFGGGKYEFAWFVSKRDWLPRRIDWLFQGPDGGTVGASTILTELRTNPKFETDPFQLKVPEGYTQTDDFAP